MLDQAPKSSDEPKNISLTLAKVSEGNPGGTISVPASRLLAYDQQRGFHPPEIDRWHHLRCQGRHRSDRPAGSCRRLAGQSRPAILGPLPEDKGTYVLIASVGQMKRLEVGALGKFDIVPGFYSYVGSAFGPGGLRGRIGHHLESTAAPHWHIDYLLQIATPVEVWYTTQDRKLERHWADLMVELPGFRAAIRRFGSSDYHRSRSSHLFYSKRRPSFRRFQESVRDKCEGVEVGRHCIIAQPDEASH